MVAIRLEGIFDSKRQIADKEFTIGSNWAEVAIDFRPPSTLTAELRAHLSVPKGATVLIDKVRFRPNDPRSGLEK